MIWRSLFLLTFSPTALWAEPITVFAAASLRDVLLESAGSYDADVRFSFAGSSVLARQVAAGAPADIYISANALWMDWAENQGVIDGTTRRDIAGNQLVLIGPNGAGDVALERATFDDQRIAMGLVQAVPAGIYGREALQSLGLWDDLRSRVVQTDNVRAALALVALGEVPFGITYASDAVAEPKVTILARFETGLHSEITYPAARTIEGKAEAAGFLDHLMTPAVQAIFADHGFEAVEP